MIFPEHCKQVGHASFRACGDSVYFLSRYLIHETPKGPEILEIVPDQSVKGMMRPILSTTLLARTDEVYRYPEKVNLHDRTRLVELALDTGFRCTIFTGHDEHMTFVLDPDLSDTLTIHVYDISPPRPSLSSSIREMEAAGLFGSLGIRFAHHIRDIAGIRADMYPCRAAGFDRTLDADPVKRDDLVAGCLTASQFITEIYGRNFQLVNICPLECITEEPFIARCCRSEREGKADWNGRRGIIVHWGAEPAKIYEAVGDLVRRWRQS